MHCSGNRGLVGRVWTQAQAMLGEEEAQEQPRRGSFSAGRRRTASSISSCSSAGCLDRLEEEADARESLAQLALVARRRTEQQAVKQGLGQRLKAALKTDEPVVLVYQLLCEIADVALTHFQRALAESPLWVSLTDGGYNPGDVFRAPDAVPSILEHGKDDGDACDSGHQEEGPGQSNAALDMFVQLVCGWADAATPFGPIVLEAESKLARALTADGPLPDEVYGTVRLARAQPRLPPGVVTTRIVDLVVAARGLAHGARQARLGDSPLLLLRFRAGIQQALTGLERVVLGEGGSAKKPTEFQMHFVQRVATETVAALEAMRAPDY